MRIQPTMPLAVVAACGAGLYAAALLSDTAKADSSSAAVVNFPSSAPASGEPSVPAPRECRPDASIDTSCTFN